MSITIVYKDDGTLFNLIKFEDCSYDTNSCQLNTQFDNNPGRTIPHTQQ